MGTEIERKFLVQGESWKGTIQGKIYRQGYITNQSDKTVRVRVAGDQGFLTIKGKTEGFSRLEYEYEIPLHDAEELLQKFCEKPLIDKRRYKIPYQGFVWDVDEFFTDNQGLLVAEIELESEDQEFEKPDWIGEEVTQDHRYFNAALIKNPYSQWENY
ncbi:MAG: adenylate cyclase [bacterium]|jgi:adenylate cyclase